MCGGMRSISYSPPQKKANFMPKVFKIEVEFHVCLVTLVNMFAS